MLQDTKQVIDHITEYEATKDDILLMEDMYFLEWKEYGIDCGWYDGDVNGFITFLVKDYDWDTPIFKIVSQNIADAKWSIEICKEYLMKLV